MFARGIYESIIEYVKSFGWESAKLTKKTIMAQVQTDEDLTEGDRTAILYQLMEL